MQGFIVRWIRDPTVEQIPLLPSMSGKKSKTDTQITELILENL